MPASASACSSRPNPPDRGGAAARRAGGRTSTPANMPMPRARRGRPNCAACPTWPRSPRANGIEPHAGHGLTYDNVQPVAAIPQLAELNIGHYLIGEAIFTGLESRCGACATDGRPRGAMIIAIGSDLCNIERIAEFARPLRRTLRGARLHRGRARQGGRRPFTKRRHLRQALRRQGGLFQGGRHRFQGRRVHEGHRRGQRAQRAHRPWR
jgi:hypothetical protein